MTFSAVVLEHFRRPLNRGVLTDADVREEGANPLCGDRIVIELRAEGGVVRDARFTADACALCIAAASLLTETARGRALTEVAALQYSVILDLLRAEPPPARRKCAGLPLETMRRAAGRLMTRTA